MAPVLVGGSVKYQMRDLNVGADLVSCELGTQNWTWINVDEDHSLDCQNYAWNDAFSLAWAMAWQRWFKGVWIYIYIFYPSGMYISHRYRSRIDVIVAKQLWEYFHTVKGVVRSMQSTWRCHRVFSCRWLSFILCVLPVFRSVLIFIGIYRHLYLFHHTSLSGYYAKTAE